MLVPEDEPADAEAIRHKLKKHVDYSYLHLR